MSIKSASMSKKILSAADAELFRSTVGPVKTIETDRLLLKPKRKPVPRPKTFVPDLDTKLDHRNADDLTTVNQEDTLSFLSPGVQKNILKKLRQGYFGLDAELDLHGLTSQAAKQQLLKFLHRCVQNGCRSVHIIHGKGYRSEDQLPVLKNHLNNWLRQHNDVLAFCSASQRDGGAGAVVVLLHVSDKF